MNQKHVLFQFSWRNFDEALLQWNCEVGFEDWITETMDSNTDTRERRASDQGG
jgi:hypothetical protein